MKTLSLCALLAAAAFAVACKKKAEAQAQAPVDNSATRYVGSLQNDVKKAEDAAAKATAAIQKTNAGVNQATDAQ